MRRAQVVLVGFYLCPSDAGLLDLQFSEVLTGLSVVSHAKRGELYWEVGRVYEVSIDDQAKAPHQGMSW